MAKCLNCGAAITCGCQKRTASDGKSCCSTCVASYEKKVNMVKRVAQPVTQPQQIPFKKDPNKFGF